MNNAYYSTDFHGYESILIHEIDGLGIHFPNIKYRVRITSFNRSLIKFAEELAQRMGLSEDTFVGLIRHHLALDVDVFSRKEDEIEFDDFEYELTLFFTEDQMVFFKLTYM